MKHGLTILASFLLLTAGCGAVTSRAPVRTTPQEASACAAELLASMGYDLVEQEPVVRGERAKHAAFGHMRADYDRVAAGVEDGELRVRGETVSMSGGGKAMSLRGDVQSSAGGTTMSAPSKQVRVDVRRIAAECGGTG